MQEANNVIHNLANPVYTNTCIDVMKTAETGKLCVATEDDGELDTAVNAEFTNERELPESGQEEPAAEAGPVYLTAPAPAEGFPVDDWQGVESLHQDQISAHYGKRCIDLGKHYAGCNVVTVIDDLMKQYGHPNPTKWREYIEKDALLEEFDEGTRIELARSALHIALLTLINEDVSNLIYAINSKDTGPYWLGYFERHVVPSFVRLDR